MRKKAKSDKFVRIIVSEFPPSYDPLAKGLVEKLAHANKVGLGEIANEEDGDDSPAYESIKQSKNS